MGFNPSGIGPSSSMGEGWRTWRKIGETLTACQSMMFRVLVGCDRSVNCGGDGRAICEVR